MLSAVGWRLKVPEVKVFLPAACTSLSPPPHRSHLAFCREQTVGALASSFCSQTLASETRHWARDKQRQNLGSLERITVFPLGWRCGETSLCQPYRPQCVCLQWWWQSVSAQERSSFMWVPFWGSEDTCLTEQSPVPAASHQEASSWMAGT